MNLADYLMHNNCVDKQRCLHTIMLQIIDEQSTPTDIKGGIAVQDIIQAYSFQQLLTLTFEVPLHPKINMQSVSCRKTILEI